jgi:DNA-3-methyladenine glycosylase I
VLFEFLILEGATGGIELEYDFEESARTTEKAFDGFRAEKIARYNKRDVQRLLSDDGIVRKPIENRSSNREREKLSRR